MKNTTKKLKFFYVFFMEMPKKIINFAAENKIETTLK